jgi:archaeosine-15-forming tRNA-guanine transglycosylase
VNSETRYLQVLRQLAAMQLPPDFARRVMRESDRFRIQRASRIRVIAVTGALCALLAVAFHVVSLETAQRDNLASWTRMAAQAQALEVSL